METSLDRSLASGYKSKSQIARVLTESWTSEHMYCPVCGWPRITKFPNNRAVADFYCPNCRNEFEQKARMERLALKLQMALMIHLFKESAATAIPIFL
ncbi:MAG: hypothetical protein LUF91_03760 [Oscillospiraceae bacterium]|nr:hypothetical protein [Oscillospiraceae bacterium]